MKIIAWILSVVITIYCGIIQNADIFRGAMYAAGLPTSFIGSTVAKAVREKEAGEMQRPEKAPGRHGGLPDDTGADFVTDPELGINAETWVANEITLESTVSYGDPFNDAELELILVGNGVKYIVPGFWDGGNTWKVRFVCPSEGEWLFKTSCSDKNNTGLDRRTGRVICTKYSGELEIYKHGFVTTAYGEKYLTYDDGTPFFYLGDTHWSLGDETQDMVKTICAKRAEQGFTVFQSEPIGAGFLVENGVSEADMAGFADYDAKFKTIADAGLTHANAEFFFPAYMDSLIKNMGGYSDTAVIGADGKPTQIKEISEQAKLYLERLSRYWVARYSAYPVLWTLGQEVDNDFYWTDDNHPEWNSLNNPYKLVAEYIDRFDPYCHPISAHQENSGSTAAYGSGEGRNEKLTSYCGAAPSVFRDCSAHDWYAVQWSPSLTHNSSRQVEKDYWYNSQGKPAINYEGRYCYLWTKNFGSRAQGWISYLSGMYGYGWGAHDTWSYLNIYDEENDSSDGVDTITSAEKINATWQDALTYPSSDQMGYMKNFFGTLNWWELIPRFDDKRYFRPDAGVYYCAASNDDNSDIVLYFYSFADESIGEKPNADLFGGTMTGRVGSLEPGTEYRYRWFNPVSGEYSEEGSFVSTSFGTWNAGAREMNGEQVTGDMVLHIYK